LKRLVHQPKRYLIDPGLMAAALRLDVQGVMRDGDVLGRVLDTFVAAQLRPELAVSVGRPRLHHLRTEQGRHEVDLIVEMAGGRLIAIEVKAGAAPTPADAKHLIWLREELGDRFAAGVVLHTGPRVYGLGEQVVAAPICSLWG
jgi:predicted AAA+ superfamily ATPase